MAELPTYITLEEAARRYHLSQQMLTRAVENGIIRAVKVNGGIIAVAEGDVRIAAGVFAKRDALWKQVNHLDGVPIGLEEAGIKYHLSLPSIYQWIKRGYVRVLRDEGRGRGHKRMLNEADIAYIALVAKERGQLRGRRIVSREFIPPHCAFSAT